MKNRKKIINTLQNLAMILLTVSALFIISRFPFFSGNLSSQMQALLSSESAMNTQSQVSGRTAAVTSAHLMVTNDSKFGRFSKLYASPDDALFAPIIPLFQEALGSAGNLAPIPDHTFQKALETPGLYLDLTCQLPLPVVAAWLGDETVYQQSVRALALTTEDEVTASLYLVSEDGTTFHCDTALPCTVVRDITLSFSPNGGSFAFESDAAQLAPYTVLVAEIDPLPTVVPGLPGGYSAYNLLSALDFNPHTNSRYTESSGTEVVEESPRMLRISPDGLVSYSGKGEISSPLFHISTAESVTMGEALQAAYALAAALSEGTDASELSLCDIRGTDRGWTVSFRYQVNQIPVILPGDNALTVTISGNTITEFTYRCRAYTIGEDSTVLMPPAMAAAVAAQDSGQGLSISYVDTGADTLSALWLGN